MQHGKKNLFLLNLLFPGAFYDITPFFCFFLALMLVRLMQDSNFYIFTPTETTETQRMLKPVVTRLHWVVSCVGPQQKWRSSYFSFPLTETGYLRTVDKRNGSYFRVRTTWTPPPVGGSCVRPNGPSWLPVWFCCFLVPRTLHQTWTLFKREPGPLLQKLLGGAWSRKSLTFQKLHKLFGLGFCAVLKNLKFDYLNFRS